jgi:hypothetical protein
MGVEDSGEDDGPREKKACNTASRQTMIDMFNINPIVKEL